MDYSYETFKIPGNKKRATWLLKKRGVPATQLHHFLKYRVIESPNEELKIEQRRILSALYNVKALRPSPFCHGFMPFRNAISNAFPHVNKKWVVGTDIKDFFPSIRADVFIRMTNFHQMPDNMVKVLLQRILQYCFKYDGKLGPMTPQQIENLHGCYWEKDDAIQKNFYLPQGSPASPFVSNIFLRKLDWEMARFCVKEKTDFSRYADDITFSGDDKKVLQHVLMCLTNVLKRYGLELNKRKTRFLPWCTRQLVCGVVVNQKINARRRFRRNMRAMLHNAGGDLKKLSRHQKGELAYLQMFSKLPVDARKTAIVINLVDMNRQLSGGL